MQPRARRLELALRETMYLHARLVIVKIGIQ
jgi:hypothetical protein